MATTEDLLNCAYVIKPQAGCANKYLHESKSCQQTCSELRWVSYFKESSVADWIQYVFHYEQKGLPYFVVCIPLVEFIISRDLHK